MTKKPEKKATKKPAKPVAKIPAKPAVKTKVPAAKAATSKAKPAKVTERPAKPAPFIPRQVVPQAPHPAPISAVKAPSVESVKAFEQAMNALQRHDYKTASTTFEMILSQFPNEGFLVDRARVYLELAARELRRRPADSGNIEERLTAATLALNNHNDVEAARLATDVLNEDRAQDLAEYLLAVVASRGGDVETALAHLRNAIRLNPECRLQARQDEEFDPLMDSDDFHALIEPPTASAAPSAAAQPVKKPVRKTGR